MIPRTDARVEPVADDCPHCSSSATVTSAFAASRADDLDRLSAWCEDCGYSFGAESLEGGGSA
ncbi:MAG: hypothetical protein ACOCUO_00880 [archaeon]